MTGMPFGKFFWSDWETDPGLKLCSFAAQGLWMRLLCIAAKHDPIGYVAVSGQPLNADAIARMTGGTLQEVADLLGELERNGVFSRNAKDCIYSRRMVRDEKRRRIAVKNGKAGGNPSLRKQSHISGGDKGEVKGEDKGGHKTHIPEARDSVAKATGASAPSDDPIKQMFDLGIEVLTGTGSTPKQARSLVGKWRSAKGDAWVLQMLIDAKAKSITEPVAWVEARLGGSPLDEALQSAQRARERHARLGIIEPPARLAERLQ